MSAIFNPPLSTQRYCWVQDFISQDESIKTITDVGSATGRILIWLKHIANLELVNCVDKCLSALDDGIEQNFQPNLYEMLFGRKNSEKNLDIRVYHGDIVVPDDRLRADIFTMVELIEHMPLDHLERVCQTVFGYYNPRYIIVTTPNRETNPLIRLHAAAQKARLEQETVAVQIHQQQASCSHSSDISIDNSRLEQDQAYQFRHHDHKFEWDRTEFGNWANLMSKTYAYEVVFSGVGYLPDSEPFGPATQIALFKRCEDVRIGKTLTDPTLCFDLFLNKLSVKEDEPEFLGDTTLRKICLRAKYYIPGTPASKLENEQTYHTQWDEMNQEDANNIDYWSEQTI